MRTTQADRLARAAKSLRSSLLTVLRHTDELCAGLAQLQDATIALASASPGASRQAPDEVLLRVDRDTLTIGWAGRECYLGYTIPFRLIDRLAQRPDHYIRVEQLMAEIWVGRRSRSAVRSAVCELRAKLTAVGMADLAALIDGRNQGRYGLMLSRR